MTFPRSDDTDFLRDLNRENRELERQEEWDEWQWREDDRLTQAGRDEERSE